MYHDALLICSLSQDETRKSAGIKDEINEGVNMEIAESTSAWPADSSQTITAHQSRACKQTSLV